jgi:hypothetical protein
MPAFRAIVTPHFTLQCFRNLLKFVDIVGLFLYHSRLLKGRGGGVFISSSYSLITLGYDTLDFLRCVDYSPQFPTLIYLYLLLEV